MSYEKSTMELDDHVERKVQLAGNSTFVVSLPKSWAVDQNLEPGMSMYLYPHTDRLVAAPETASVEDRAVTIDASTSNGDITVRHVRVAYMTGVDRITVANLEERDSHVRRAIERATSRLIGLTIQEETDDRLTITNVLDASDISLPQTIAQAQQLIAEMYTDAITALVTDDQDLAQRVITRGSDIDRLFAFVCRGFHRGLEDVHEIEQFGTDRVAAFREYRVARRLNDIAGHAERIATITTQQTGPPDDSLAERLESVAAAAHDVVTVALEKDAEGAYETAATVEQRLDDLDQCLYNGDEPDAYLYGAVIRWLRQTTASGRRIADTRTAATLPDCDPTEQ